jgi:UDP-3-O-[3-hydroxymyristoyl] glucosamine N-acyltransferase
VSEAPATSSASKRPSWSAEQAAALLQAEIIGDGSAEFSTLDSLAEAGANALTFARDASYARQWGTSRAAALLISRTVYEDPSVELEPGSGRAILVVQDADLAMLTLLDAAAQALERRPEAGVHPNAWVDPSASIGEGVSIGPGATVQADAMIGSGTRLRAGVRVGAGVRIGSDCDLRPNVVIEDRCVLGDRVVIHAGTVIGADGFGYRPNPDGTGVIKIPHIGAVEIGDDVEIGANSCVDRGKFTNTRIGSGTKIDNLVQVGHNVIIGRSCVICGNTGIAGSARIGDGVTIGGDCDIHDNVTIGNGVTLAACSGVMSDVPPGVTWGGAPAGPVKDFLRQMASLRHLPEVVKDYRRRAKEHAGEGSSTE